MRAPGDDATRGGTSATATKTTDVGQFGPSVGHVRADERFEYVLDRSRAVLRYRIAGRRLVVIDIDVPGELRGRSVAGRLSSAVIEFARCADMTLVPVCPFLRRWLRQRPELWGGLSIDWTHVQPAEPEPPAWFDPRW